MRKKEMEQKKEKDWKKNAGVNFIKNIKNMKVGQINGKKKENTILLSGMKH